MKYHHLLNHIKNSFNMDKSEIKIHITAWIVFYLVDFCFVISFTPAVNVASLYTYLSTVVLYICCFYLIVELYNRFLPENIVKGVLLSIVSVLIFSGINFFWDVFVIEYANSVERYNLRPWNLYLFETWRFSTNGLYAFAYWIYLQRIKEQQIHRETEKELYNTEEASLKAQINPHFLFNTLNFVYGDIAEKSTKAGIAILSLTKLLRYSVESTKTESTSLKKEADIVSEYIVLQNLRFDQKAYVEFNKSGPLMLFGMPPLVLLSLVENAFKYGIIDDKENPIKINLTADKNSLNFTCKNMKRLDFKDKETTSVGIANIKRRLELTYGSNYTLLIIEGDRYYEVKLEIIWKK